MVDSAVGGKTGIDAEGAKNAIGAFHHPSLVLVDPTVLRTLPPFQRVAGLAEAVKTAAVRDEALLTWIEARAEALRDGDEGELASLVERCARAKAEVVAEDPEEVSVRAVLNFGHTAAHALESLSGFSLLHGEAVAEGMRLEAALGEELGVTEAGTAARIDAALAACGLPDVLDDDVTAERLLEAARPDKKARAGAARWSLLRRPGVPARTETGAWTRAVEPACCEAALRTALRRARQAADSRA
jgi:3-dehydroquinate synthase